MSRYQSTYQKPAGMKYTDMCIFIDEKAYCDEATEEDFIKIYEYLYLICYALSAKKRYFTSPLHYDEFSLFAAGKLYMRLTNERQFNVKPGERKLKCIKSILNYIKLTLYGMKVDYQNFAFNQILNPEVDSRIDPDQILEDMRQGVQSQYNYKLRYELEDTIRTFPNIIKQVIEDTPYCNDKEISRNLYISCLISFLKSITLSKDNIKRVKKKEVAGTLTDDYKVNLYLRERGTSITLWKLNPDFKDYIKVLCSKIRKRLSREILDVNNNHELTEDVFSEILLSVRKDESKGDMDY